MKSRRHRGHLAEDLLKAREQWPQDAHVKDAAVAYLSHARPACSDPNHDLCHRVTSAVDDHVRSRVDRGMKEGRSRTKGQ